MKARFELLIYHFYSDRAVKVSGSHQIPSIGFSHRYYCKIHNRIEYLYGADIDHHLTADQLFSLPDNCIGIDTPGGNHIICSSHVSSYLKSLFLTARMTLRYHGDFWWFILGLKRRKFAWRIWGKYAEDPVPRIIHRPSSPDPVISSLIELYSYAEEISMGAVRP